MLLPALGGARDMAKRISCVSNLKQVGMALNCYVDNNRGYLPPAYYASWTAPFAQPSIAADTQMAGGTVYADYTTDRFARTVFRCPSVSDAQHCFIGDYGLNLGANSPSSYVFAPDAYPRMLTRFAHASSVIAFIDSAASSSTAPGGWISSWFATIWTWQNADDQLAQQQGACRHRGMANHLLLDGHVDSKTWSNMSSSSAAYDLWGFRYTSEFAN